MKIFRNICFAWAFILSSIGVAENLVVPDAQLGNYVAVDDLQWNRYTTAGNITILSIDDSQGKWLSDNVTLIRTQILSKWGFSDFKSQAEIRIFCVPDRDTLKKLFSIEKSRIEKRDDLIAMWVVLGSDLVSDFSPCMEEAVFYDYELNSKVDLPFWFKRGAIGLSAGVGEVNEGIKALKASVDNNQLFSMDRIFKMDPEAFDKESQQQKELFDRQATGLCLMLRREFGGIKLRVFLDSCSSEGVEKSLQGVYNFNGVAHFSKQYLHYLRDLCAQAVEDKISASYLTIKAL